MAHVWQNDTEGAWRPRVLDRERGLRLTSPDASAGGLAGPTPDAVCGPAGPCGEECEGILVLPTAVAGNEWAAVAGPSQDLRVNGQASALGLRVLSDRDELSASAAPGESAHWYFSSEEVVAVTAFPGSEHLTRCPRCKKAVEAGMPAVRCPNPQCGAWHHQISAGHPTHGERECWTYAPKCALCSQTTALDAGFRWTPEEL